MLTQIANIICSTLNTIVGFIVIKTLIGSKVKLNNFKNIGLLSILIVIPFVLYDTQYSSTFTFITFVISILVYKYIFDKNLFTSVVLVCVMFLLMSIADVLTSIIFMPFIDLSLVRSCWYLKLIINVIVFSITIMLANLRIINVKLNNFISKLENNRTVSTIIFLILITIVTFILLYNVATLYGWNAGYFINFIIMTVFVLLLGIFIKEKNSYYDLVSDYNGLFDFVQDFENQVEKEQFKIHEYNNQLAVIMSLSTEESVIDKIKAMIKPGEESEWVKGLSSVPKSGLKGLLFYKLTVAKKNGVNVTIDISKKVNEYMNRLTEKELKVLCSLVGVYFDNAIDAAKMTNEKNITLEIYISKNLLNLVIINSIDENVNLKDINKKGVSTKGKDRGRGLYFASKIIDKNSQWLSGEQKVIDDSYFMQKIGIKKENTVD